MKKSEVIQNLINIEKEIDPKKESTITMGYIHYLKQIKKLIEVGDIEIK